jgi:hypothetical protein
VEEGRQSDFAEAITEVAGLKSAENEEIRELAKQLLIERKALESSREPRPPSSDKADQQRTPQPSSETSPVLILAIVVAIVVAVFFLLPENTKKDDPSGSGETASTPGEETTNETNSPLVSKEDRPVNLTTKGPNQALLYRFQKGTVLRYEFENRQRLQIRLAILDQSDTAEQGFGLNGEMTWTCYAATDQEILVGIRFNDLQIDPVDFRKEVAEQAQSHLLEVQEELSRERIFFRMSPRGEIRELLFPGNFSDEAREKAVVPIFDVALVLSSKPASNWKATETDLTGRYESTYEVQKTEGAQIHLTKKIERYLEMLQNDPDSANIVNPNNLKVEGLAQIVFERETGRVSRAQGKVEFSTTEKESMIGLTCNRTFQVSLTKSRIDSKIAALSEKSVLDLLAKMTSFRVGEAPLTSRKRQEDLPQEKIEPDQTLQVVKQLAALFDPNRKQPLPEEIEAFQELIRALDSNEANVHLLRDLILDGKYGPILPPLLGALGSSGTDAAQEALAAIAAHSDLSVDIRADAIVHLSGVEWPSEETVAALDRFASDSSEKLASVAILGLGQVALNLSDVEPELSGSTLKSLHRRLSAPDTKLGTKTTYLLSLGNARDEKSIPLLGKFSQNEQPDLRGAAMSALASYPENPKVDKIIHSVILKDENVAVLATAMHSLSRRPSPRTTSFLTQQALVHKQPEVRGRALVYLRNNLHDPAVRKAVGQMAAQDPNENIRAEAVRVLNREEPGE